MGFATRIRFLRMIHQAQSDRLDDAIDEFESNWTSDSRLKIEQLLERYGLIESDEAVAELIRIDIELRYDHGLTADLEDYFGHFGGLLESPHRVAEIAFEDFRSRSANGHPLAASRWSGLPGIADQTWFRQLSSQARSVPGRDLGIATDDAFELTLTESGFRLVEEIGSGNFSHVYLATQQNLSDRFVVLKVVAEAMTEPESMALLQHTNIVPIFSFHQFQSRSVICMPYAGRVTLADFLKKRDAGSRRDGESLVMTVKASLEDTKVAEPTPDTQRLPRVPAADEHASSGMLDRFESLDRGELATWIFQRLASALAHSHARGVLHNDLKPSNVLIRNDGEPALLDFNLAHSLANQTPRRIGGTLPYMSPETFRGMMGAPSRPKPQSDIYGLGVMMYEFVTGRLPYAQPASIAEVDLQVAIEQRRASVTWRPEDNVSPGMEAIVTKCLQFDPGKRYEDADELQLDLQSEHENRSLQYADEPASSRCRKWVRRHPRGVTGVIVGTLLLAVLIPLGFIASSYRGKAQNLASRTAFENFTKRSNDVLAELMLDPRREREANVRMGMEPLEEFDILEEGGVEKLLSHCDDGSEEYDQAAEIIQRHVAQVAFLETNRLARLRARNELKDAGFERLDMLIDGARKIEGFGKRATLFLAAERAKLTDDMETYSALREKAELTLAKTDSEGYLEAVRMMSERDYESAVEILETLADRGTVPSAMRWTMIGRAQYNQRLHKDAILSFSQSIQRAKNSPTLYLWRGLSFLQIGNGERAKEDFLRVAKLEPENFQAWVHLGIIAEKRGELTDAVKHHTKALELSPGNPHALIVRSRVLRKLAREEEADADYAAAMRSENLDFASLITRARARTERGDPEAALADLELALHMEPNRVVIQMQIARLLAIHLERDDESIAMYDRVLAVRPEYEKALVDQAVLLAYQKKFARALANLSATQPVEDPRNMYQAACVLALTPNKRQHRRALTLLAGAILGGYEPKNLRGDTDLDSLREYDEFQTISETYELFQRSRRGQAVKSGSATPPSPSLSQPVDLI